LTSEEPPAEEPARSAPTVVEPKTDFEGTKPRVKPIQEPAKLVAPSPPVSAAAATIGGGVPLSETQIEAIVTKVFREVIERIAWEVVPDLAETIIKEELARLTQESS
jgi:hypothetical protein